MRRADGWVNGIPIHMRALIRIGEWWWDSPQVFQGDWELAWSGYLPGWFQRVPPNSLIIKLVPSFGVPCFEALLIEFRLDKVQSWGWVKAKKNSRQETALFPSSPQRCVVHLVQSVNCISGDEMGDSNMWSCFHFPFHVHAYSLSQNLSVIDICIRLRNYERYFSLQISKSDAPRFLTSIRLPCSPCHASLVFLGGFILNQSWTWRMGIIA